MYLLHYPRFLPRRYIRHRFWQHVSTKSSRKWKRELEENGIKKTIKVLGRFVPNSQARQRSLLKVLIVEDNFIKIFIICVIKHLVLYVQNLKTNDLKKFYQIEKVKLVALANTKHRCKFNKFKCYIAQSPQSFGFNSTQWSLDLCRKR